jgi:hypothetical protein
MPQVTYFRAESELSQVRTSLRYRSPRGEAFLRGPPILATHIYSKRLGVDKIILSVYIVNSCTQLANGTTEDCRGSEQPAWTVRPAYTFQTWKTRLPSVRLPGVHNSDISIMKNNQLTEKVALIFRKDFINAFNSPQFFSGPISDVNNADFGEIAGSMDQSNLPRFIQSSLKVRF